MNKTILLIILLLMPVACGSSSPNQTPVKPSRLGLLEVSFTGLGTTAFTANTRNLGLDTFQTQAISDVPDGIQLELLSRNTFDLGRRGQDGLRFLSATFRVRNANASGVAYASEQSNLSFVAVVTPNTLNQTAIRGLDRFDGSSADPALALSILPTHGMAFDFINRQAKVLDAAADWQAFGESEISALGNVLGITSLLPYGFVVRCVNNCKANSRNLAANPIAGQFDGLVTFAVRLPLQANAKDDPFRFSLLFEAITDSSTRITKSAEEPSPNAALARAAALGGASLVSSICKLRTAGINPAAPLRVISGSGLEPAGSLDTCLNGTGAVISQLGTADDIATAVAVQPNGQIVLAGQSRDNQNSNAFGLERFNPDGSLDASFGNAGKVITGINRGFANAMLIEASFPNKILVVGFATNPGGTNSDFALLRYNPNGTPDSSFGNAGRVITDNASRNDQLNALAAQVDGKILVAGSSSRDVALVRYNPNGSLDTTFGTAGIVTTDIDGKIDEAKALAIQSDGKIVVAGNSENVSTSEFVVLRFLANGQPDLSFGTAGKVRTKIDPFLNSLSAMTLQADSKILLAGMTGSNSGDFALLRFNPDGSLDASFGNAGTVTTDIGTGSQDFANAIGLQADGKIVLAGQTSNQVGLDFALARYNPNGSLDSSFGSAGKVISDLGSDFELANALAFQTDGKVLAAGTSFLNGAGGAIGSFAFTRHWL
jgi:uncharacterized delta-60 repeat protein